MRKLRVVPNFTDGRGHIDDLIVEPLDSCTRIFTAAGHVRGNHYHRETHQWTYVIAGSLHVVTRDAGVRMEGTLFPDELMYSPPHEAHAWQALEDTTVLVLTRGPRSGMNYEQDTYRLPDDRRLIE